MKKILLKNSPRQEGQLTPDGELRLSGLEVSTFTWLLSWWDKRTDYSHGLASDFHIVTETHISALAQT